MNYYIAKVSVRQCMADIRINDVPLIRKSIDADLTVEIPINYLIESSGKQTLTLQILPLVESVSLRQGAGISVEIWRYDGSGFKIVPIEQVCSYSLSVGEEDKEFPYKYDKNIFIANVSYQIKRWSDCEVIKERAKIASAVADFYQEIGQILANKQYSLYLELIRNRERNICTALSQEEKDTNRRNELLFDCLDTGFVLQPTKGNRLHFYANNRIVTVLYKDMKSALRFINEETGEILAIELLLGIKEGHKTIEII